MLDRLADVLVGYCSRVREGELVIVQAPTLAAPLVRELYARIVRAGGHAQLRLTVDGAEEALMLDGNDAQVSWVNPRAEPDLENADARIAVFAAWNTRSLTNADPAKQAKRQVAYQPLQERFLARAARGEVRWLVTGFPHDAAAMDAGMAPAEYEDFVYRASFLDRDDPVAEWEGFSAKLERLSAFLGSKQELRIVSDGTDLTVGIGGRHWVASHGHENFPDGEVFTGPVEDSLEGTIRFTYPAIFHGREVDDVRLRFEGGEVVEATAARGEAFLREMIALDDGARRAGEFAFGMNDAVTVFTKNTLFDEKLGGSVHLALGAAYPETGGVNTSGLHWDMVCDLRAGSEVFADGELVYRDGEFVAGIV